MHLKKRNAGTNENGDEEEGVGEDAHSLKNPLSFPEVDLIPCLFT